MALYTRKEHDKHQEAVDAAESCLSAAIAHSEYAGRLAHFLDDYTEISCMFWARCPITGQKMDAPGSDVRDMARMFQSLIIGMPISGLESKRVESMLERCRRKIKGQLFKTRMILSASDGKAKCDNKDNHVQPCHCKPLHLYQLAQLREAAADANSQAS